MNVRMPFGRFRGVLISALPNDYLDWLVTIELRPPLRTAVWIEIQQRRTGARFDAQPVTTPTDLAIHVTTDDVPLVLRVFDAGYRVTARSLHPDLGGDIERMKRLNAIAESFRTQLRELGSAQ